MAANFKQPGERLELTAPGGGVVSGTPLVIGAFFGVPLVTAAAGAKFAMQLCGVFTLPKKVTGVAWTEGQRLYWDGAAVSNVGADGPFIGAAAAAALDAAVLGDVMLAGGIIDAGDVEGPQPAIADWDLTLLAGAAGNSASEAIPDPANAPATQDALRDDIVANTLPKIRNNFADLGKKFNDLLAALRIKGTLLP